MSLEAMAGRVAPSGPVVWTVAFASMVSVAGAARSVCAITVVMPSVCSCHMGMRGECA